MAQHKKYDASPYINVADGMSPQTQLWGGACVQHQHVWLIWNGVRAALWCMAGML